MSLVGYARVSTHDQDLTVQIDQLKAAGAEKVFSEKVSAVKMAERIEFAACLSYVREGDTLLVTRLDRIARSIVDLKGILDTLEKKGVAFQCLQQPVETKTSAGRLMITMLGAFAEFELDLRKERQAEGIAKAKEQGKYVRKVTPAQIESLKAEGMGAAAIAKRLNCGRATVYRTAPHLWA